MSIPHSHTADRGDHADHDDHAEHPGHDITGHGHGGHDHGGHPGRQHSRDDGQVLDDASEWDERYRGDGDDQSMWSGHPNGSLVVEVADMAPGTVLDVGCGEGADAVWLARRGWQVTALDPSAIAIARGRAAADPHDAITWVVSGLLDMPDGSGTHDLVSLQYPAIRTHGSDRVARAVLDAVAPGGTLLFVHHDVSAMPPDAPFDPADYVMPPDVVALLDDDWVVEVDELRARPGPLPDDARHVDDVVLRARRRVPDDA